MCRDNLFQTINISTTLQNMFKNINSFYSFMKNKVHGRGKSKVIIGLFSLQ